MNGKPGAMREARGPEPRHLEANRARGQLAPGALAPGLPAPRAPLRPPVAQQEAVPPAAVSPAAREADGGVAPAQRRTGGPGSRALPRAARVLAVIARPGQESADLGGLLAAYHLRGAWLGVLSLTRGEASEMNSTCEQLEAVRPWELQVAAGLLGVSSVTVADYPDGRLGYLPPATLSAHIRRAIRRSGAGLLLVVDPAAAADLDTAAVARAARLAAERSGLPVLARTLPGPGGRWPVDLGADGPAARVWQARAIGAHRSQHPPGGPAGPWPGTTAELVRWLVPPAVPAVAPEGGPAPSAAAGTR